MDRWFVLVDGCMYVCINIECNSVLSLCFREGGILG